jgi:hypothetical protein
LPLFAYFAFVLNMPCACVHDLCLLCACAAGVAAARDAGWAEPLLCWRDAGSKTVTVWREADSNTVTVLQDDNNLRCVFCVCFVHAIGFRFVWSWEVCCGLMTGVARECAGLVAVRSRGLEISCGTLSRVRAYHPSET